MAAVYEFAQFKYMWYFLSLNSNRSVPLLKLVNIFHMKCVGILGLF